MPDELKKLNYEGYQQIRFLPDTAPWQDQALPFTFQFFFPGYLYQDGVLIHLLNEGRVNDFPFSPNDFDYGTNRFPQAPPGDLKFAGLRILYLLNSPQKQDEVASFVGASYYRLLGAGQRYGISARALAIDTAEPTGEEFPRLTEFWVQRPAQAATQLEFFALLDSPRAAGAYRFLLKPGKITVMDVEAHLFLRKEIRKLGIAPLTSMFLVGANRTRFVPNFRPEVHDSDGLLIETAGGEWQWRPLLNPDKAHHVSPFAADNVKGFGLLQRHRNFQDYEDLVARFDLRPNLWVEPRASWGPGVIELVEIPTGTEWNDNIVAYWVPKEQADPGHEFHYAYSQSASLSDPPRPPLWRAQSTRIDPPRDNRPPRFLIDFTGPGPVPSAPAGPVAAKVEASRGEVRNLVTERNEVSGGWRVFFDLIAPGTDAVELRAALCSGEKRLSETWIYRWIPYR